MNNVKQYQNIEHERIIQEMYTNFKKVFDSSPMGVYLYLDDIHKICNQRMADMFGMTVEEWSAAPTFLADFVEPSDQEVFAENYYHHVAQLTHPTVFRFRAHRKNGEKFTAETDMIPLSWQGYPIAYHFVREIRD